RPPEPPLTAPAVPATWLCCTPAASCAPHASSESGDPCRTAPRPAPRYAAIAPAARWHAGGMRSAAERLIGRLRRYVADERVLGAIGDVPREVFVAPEPRAEAWRNRPLPIGEGQTISQPLVVARMAELLALTPEDRVLDVGTGSGYHAAILA